MLSLLLLIVLSENQLCAQATGYQWPEITQETKPWTRWWWMGSAVNPTDLTRLLTEYQKSGLGGVEVTPIYGVKGYEKQFINYLSPKWMDVLGYTLKEAKRLDLGVDMAQASGWPFGGPWVTPEDACKYITYLSFTLNSGEKLNERILYVQKPLVTGVGKAVDIKQLIDPISSNPNMQLLAVEQVRYEKEIPLKALMAYSDNGTALNLTSKVDDKGKLNWVAPEGKWVLYALFQGWHGKLVERAGPGGEGDVIDHFSSKAASNYFKHFDRAFLGKDITGIRAFFNDSYEVDDAEGQGNWTPELLDEFRTRRGYDLLNFLPALFGRQTEELNKRVRSDYRETISDLILEKFSKVWHSWAASKGKIIRNQAHGAPGNLLDLYAVSDIPETEGNDLLNIKMASSAAHITGKRLVSSETATWENEHFLSNLSGIKKAVDRFFLGGVNHIFYHGTNYSPANEAWPGWQFYASSELNPENSLWDHFSAVNHYVTRVQSFLQSGKSNNDLLVYYPIYDGFADTGQDLLLNFHDVKREFPNSSFVKESNYLLERGYPFDFISDRQLADLSVADKLLKTKTGSYKTLVFYEPKFMPLATLKFVLQLAKNGATVIFLKSLPLDIPGLANLGQGRKEFKSLLEELHFKVEESGIRKADIGKGNVLLGDNVTALLNLTGLKREEMLDQGLQMVRREYEGGNCYFITNWQSEKVSGWIPLSVDLTSAVIFNPMTAVSGKGRLSRDQSGRKTIYLQLNPGESCIVQTFNEPVSGAEYPYFEFAGKAKAIHGNWIIDFIKGGPVLPGQIKTGTLKSWTSFPDENLKRFSGMASYRIQFSKPEGNVDSWLLDLGGVKESAVVVLNGKEIAKLIGPVFQLNIPASEFKLHNKLEIKVANLMANRIADLDKRNVPWKKFYNINFISLFKENRDSTGQFSFSAKSPLVSGLLGPVTLTPLKTLRSN